MNLAGTIQVSRGNAFLLYHLVSNFMYTIVPELRSSPLSICTLYPCVNTRSCAKLCTLLYG